MAIDILKKAEAKFPNDEQVKETLKNLSLESVSIKLDTAANYYNNKDFQSAIDEYLSIQPPTSDSMLGVASSYQNLGDKDKAIEYYKKAFELSPTNSDIAYYVAALYAEKDDMDNARIYAEKSLTLNKTNNQAKVLLENLQAHQASQSLEKAIALFDENKYDESLEILNQIISSNPKEAYALYYRGMISDAKEKYSESITDYKKAISINPDLLIVNYLIGVDYDMLEKYKDALSYYKAFIATYSEDDDYSKYAKTRIDELSKYVK